MQCFNQQVFAERYRMKFIIKEEVGVTACTTDDSEMEDEEDEVSQLKMITVFHVEDPSDVIKFESLSMSSQDEDEFQNAEEELELDQSSELYKTIVAAIIKEEDNDDLEEGTFEKLEEDTTSRSTGVGAQSPGELWEEGIHQLNWCIWGELACAGIINTIEMVWKSNAIKIWLYQSLTFNADKYTL